MTDFEYGDMEVAACSRCNGFIDYFEPGEADGHFLCDDCREKEDELLAAIQELENTWNYARTETALALSDEPEASPESCERARRLLPLLLDFTAKQDNMFSDRVFVDADDGDITLNWRADEDTIYEITVFGDEMAMIYKRPITEKPSGIPGKKCKVLGIGKPLEEGNLTQAEQELVDMIQKFDAGQNA